MNQSFPEPEVYNYGSKPYTSLIPHQPFAPSPPQSLIKHQYGQYDTFK